MIKRRLIAPFGIIVLIAASLLVLGGAGEATFKPSWGASGTTPVTFSTTATGGHPDITVPLNIDAPSNNFSESVTFADSAVTTGALTVGSYVGSLDSVAQLGLANSGCFNSVPVTFNFVAATVSQTNVISPSGPVTNVNANFAEDDGDLNNDHQTTLTVAASAGATSLTVGSSAVFSVGNTVFIGGATTAESKVIATIPNATTITLTAATTIAHAATDILSVPDIAGFAFNGIADGSDAYPSFLQTAFLGIVPQHRYMGVAFVANSLIVILNLVVFAPGDLAALPNHAWMTSVWGTPSVAILNDPVAAPSNSSITDFCNFTSVTFLYGVSQDNRCTPLVTAQNQAGCTGTGAGFKLRLACNTGASCPTATTPNEAGQNRATSPGAAQTLRWRQYAMSLRNADGDGIDNANDTCPLVTDTVWDPYAVASAGDTDGDGIPDTCDSTPSGTDQDNDTWSNRGDNCPQVANGTFTLTPNFMQYDEDIGPAVTVPDGGSHSDSIGPACDPNPTVPNGRYHATVIAQKICIGGATADCSTGTDTDGDGIFNAFDNCIAGGNSLIAGYSQSQRDLNADNTADISDIALIGGQFGKVGGTPGATAGYEGRLDLNYDSTIDISDISLEGGVFGKTC